MYLHSNFVKRETNIVTNTTVKMVISLVNRR
jgi:hypothetical protein